MEMRNKTKVEMNQDALREQLEESLTLTYGLAFVIDLQKLSEVDGRYTTPIKDKVYLGMLRGAWYASKEK